jgi:hypothetical protein
VDPKDVRHWRCRQCKIALAMDRDDDFAVENNQEFIILNKDNSASGNMGFIFGHLFVTGFRPWPFTRHEHEFYEI